MLIGPDAKMSIRGRKQKGLIACLCQDELLLYYALAYGEVSSGWVFLS